MPSAQNFPGYATGSYLAALTTGVLGATLAADAPVAALRCGPTQTAAAIMGGVRRICITEIGLKVSGVVAFTAPQQFGLYLERFSVAALAGGAAALIAKLGSSTFPNSVALTGGPEAGDARVSTTAALTSAGVTFDALKVPVYQWSTVGPAEYTEVILSFTDNPIRLEPGEGLAVRNQIVWPAAGTATVKCYFKFEERVW